jgi:3-oxoacyl-[acyl-carrier-protein] synthase III
MYTSDSLDFRGRLDSRTNFGFGAVAVLVEKSRGLA